MAIAESTRKFLESIDNQAREFNIDFAELREAEKRGEEMRAESFRNGMKKLDEEINNATNETDSILSGLADKIKRERTQNAKEESDNAYSNLLTNIISNLEE